MCTCPSDPTTHFASLDPVAPGRNASTYDAPGDVDLDVDLDGDVDSTDKTTVQSYTATKGGRGNLSHAEHGNRKGYAGYEFDDAIVHDSYHVRHRMLNSVLSQCGQRDPLGYHDSASMYSYVGSTPLTKVDPDGRVAWAPIILGGVAIGGLYWKWETSHCNAGDIQNARARWIVCNYHCPEDDPCKELVQPPPWGWDDRCVGRKRCVQDRKCVGQFGPNDWVWIGRPFNCTECGR